MKDKSLYRSIIMSIHKNEDVDEIHRELGIFARNIKERKLKLSIWFIRT